MNIVRFSLKSLVLVVLTISLCSHASWDLDDISLYSREEKNRLQDVQYVALKKKIVEELMGTWSSSEKTCLIMDVISLHQPKKALEIGVFTGSSLVPIAAAMNFWGCEKVYAVDAWSNDAAVEGIHPYDPNYAWWKAVDMEIARANCERILKKHCLMPMIEMIHERSGSAVIHFKEEELDFIHFDGSFDPEVFLKDVELYLPKLRNGGVVLVSNLQSAINGEALRFRCLEPLLEYCEALTSTNDFNSLFLIKTKKPDDDV